MIRAPQLLTFLLISACSNSAATSEKWKSSYSAAECAALMSEKSIVARCGEGELVLAMEVISDDITQCLPFSPPIKLEGIWIEGFELSLLYKEAKTLGDVTTPDGGFVEPFTWLSMTDGASRDLTLQPARDFAAYKIEAVGRQSLCKGQYGHMGNGSHEVIVTDFLNVIELPTAE